MPNLERGNGKLRVAKCDEKTSHASRIDRSHGTLAEPMHRRSDACPSCRWLRSRQRGLRKQLGHLTTPRTDDRHAPV